MTPAIFAALAATLLFQGDLDQPRGSVSGRVSLLQTGQGIGGVQVQVQQVVLRGPPAQTTTTAPDGTFSFPSLPAGDYFLQAQKHAYQAAQPLPMRIKLDKDHSAIGIEMGVATLERRTTGSDSVISPERGGVGASKKGGI